MDTEYSNSNTNNTRHNLKRVLQLYGRVDLILKKLS